MAEPTASIVIPTHNRPGLLRAAVASALAALPEGGEVVVSDDRSAPPAAEALADMAHPALRVVANAGGRGAAANRNAGVRAARGAVIFFLDDDDLMLPGYPAAILDRVAREAELVWGFSATSEHTRGAAPVARPGDERGALLTGGAFRKRLAGLGCGFWIRRKAFLDSGGIDETLTVNEDTEFSLRLLAAGHSPYYSPVPGVSLLLHGQGSGAEAGQLTKTTDPAERARCFRAILDRHAAFLAREKEGNRHLLRRLLKMQAKAGFLRAGLGTACGEGPSASRPLRLLYFLVNFALYRLRA